MRTSPEGSLWRAIDETLDRQVTVRVMHSGHPFAADVVDAARRAALVEDVRLLRIVNVGEEAHGVFIVTELLTGSTLADEIRRGPLAGETARRIIGEAAQALDRAEARGLHHLKLVPESVVVSAASEVKLLGVAVDAAVAGIDPDDAVQASRLDTIGLVNLLYAGLTGRWPGGGDTGVPPAPRVGGLPVPPGDLVAGVPNDLDTLCAVTLGPHDDGPRTPRELALQLAPWAGLVPLSQPSGLSLGGPERPVITPRAVDIVTGSVLLPIDITGRLATPVTPAPDPVPAAAPDLVPHPEPVVTAEPASAEPVQVPVANAPVPDLRRAQISIFESTTLPGDPDRDPRPDRLPAGAPLDALFNRREQAPSEPAPQGPPEPVQAQRTSGLLASRVLTAADPDEKTADVERGGIERGETSGLEAVTAFQPVVNPVVNPVPEPVREPSLRSLPPEETESLAGLLAEPPRAQTHPLFERTVPEPAAWNWTDQGPTAGAPSDLAVPPSDLVAEPYDPAARPTRTAAGEGRAADVDVREADVVQGRSSRRALLRAGGDGRNGAGSGLAPHPEALDGGQPEQAQGRQRSWLGPPSEPTLLPSVADAWATWSQAEPVAPAAPIGPFSPPVPLTRPPRDQSRFVIALLAALVLVGLVLAVMSLRNVLDAPGITGTPVPTLSAPAGAQPSPGASGSPSADVGSSSVAPPPSDTSPSSTAPGNPPVIAAVTPLDPYADQVEQNSTAGLMIDGKASTSWSSDGYQSPVFGGLKPGLGLSLDFGGKPGTVHAVTVAMGGTGWTAELRTSPDGAYAGSTIVALGTGNGGKPVTLNVEPAVTSRYLVLWFTKLPKIDGKWRLLISEITVR